MTTQPMRTHGSRQASPARRFFLTSTIASTLALLALGSTASATVYFQEDFSDNSAGWSLGPEWAIGPTATSSGQSTGFGDPAFDHSPGEDNGVAGIVLGGNAGLGLHGSEYLTSPVVNLSAATGPVYLKFWRWLNSDYTPFMQNTVEVFDGANWVPVFVTGSSPGVTDGAWTFVSYDVTAYKNANFQVRYGMSIGSSAVFSVSSWNVDDVRLSSDPAFEVSAVAAKGQPVAAAGSDPHIGTGAVWTALYTPAVGDGGKVAYAGKWKAGKVTGSGMFIDNTLVVAAGDPVPGIAGATFKTFKDPVIDGAGHIAFIASIAGTGVTTADDTVVIGNGGGVLEVVAREGAAAPGISATFKAFKDVSISAGLGGGGVAFTASLAGATTADDSGVWWKQGSGALEVLIREGGTVDGLTGTVKSFQVLKAVAGSPGQGRGLTTGNHALFQVIMSDAKQAIVSEEGAVAATDDLLGISALPESKWSKLGIPTASSNGLNIGLLGELKKGFDGVTATNGRGIFRSTDAGSSWAPVARKTEPAPGFGESYFYTFKDPVMAATSQATAFIAQLKGGTVTTANDSTVWWTTPNGTLTAIAQEGAQPPAAPAGAKWKSFDSLALPGGAVGPIFTAHLAIGPDITTANDIGLYAVNSSGSLVSVVREGDTLLGKVVKSFQVLKAVSGSAGSSRSFSSANTIVLLATFADNSTGIVKISEL